MTSLGIEHHTSHIDNITTTLTGWYFNCYIVVPTSFQNNLTVLGFTDFEEVNDGGAPGGGGTPPGGGGGGGGTPPGGGGGGGGTPPGGGGGGGTPPIGGGGGGPDDGAGLGGDKTSTSSSSDRPPKSKPSN